MSQATREDVVVVVPTYRREDFMPTFLSAIWQGSTRPRQVFLVDNAQSATLAQIAAAFPGTVVVRNPINIGCSANYAKATAVGLGTGSRYVVLGSDDDLWSPQLLTELVTVADRTNADCVFGSCMYWVANELSATDFLAGRRTSRIWRPAFIEAADDSNSSPQPREVWLFACSAQPTGLLMRARPDSAPEFVDTSSWCPDWAGLGRWCIDGAQFRFVDQALVAKRADEVSTTGRGTPRAVSELHATTQRALFARWLNREPSFEQLERVAAGVPIDRLYAAFAAMTGRERRVEQVLGAVLRSRRSEAMFPWTLPPELLSPLLRAKRKVQHLRYAKRASRTNRSLTGATGR